MKYVRASGRYNRAAVIGRARELRAAGLSWQDAVTQAYREARAERTRLTPRIAISAREASHA